MEPTYKILNDYEYLFGISAGKDRTAIKGDLEKTLEVIKEIIRDYNYQVKKLAKHLKGDTLLQSAYNIWHFCNRISKGGNINYKLDKRGYEEIRTPGRSFRDRFIGIDCDDFTILCSSLLLNMGYKPQMVIVDTLGDDRYNHIYTSVGAKLENGIVRGGVIVDPVMDAQFNQHPAHIRKSKIIDMKIQVLEGNGLGSAWLDEIPKNAIFGFGAVESPDAATRAMMDYQSDIIEKAMVSGFGSKDSVFSKELRKTRFGILMNGTDERNTVLDILPHVDDIDDDGNFVFESKAERDKVDEYVSGLYAAGLVESDIYEDEYDFDGLGLLRRKRVRRTQEDREMRELARDMLKEDMLQGLLDIEIEKDGYEEDDYEEDNYEVGELYDEDELGRRKKRRAKRKAKKAKRKAKRKAKVSKIRKRLKKVKTKIKAKVKKVAAKIKAGAKKLYQKAKAGIKKAAKGLVTLSMAPVRAAFLSVARLNMFKVSSKFYPGYLSTVEAVDKGLDAGEHKKVVDAVRKLEKFWEKMGGRKATLRKVILAGGKKNFEKGLKGIDIDDDDFDFNEEDLEGLGAYAAIAKVAGKILGVIKKWIKKINFKKLFAKIKARRAAKKSGAKEPGAEEPGAEEPGAETETETTTEFELSPENGGYKDDKEQDFVTKSFKTTGDDDDEKKNKWLVPVILGGLVLGVLGVAVATGGSKKKK